MRDRLNTIEKLAAFERVNNRYDYLIIALIVAVFVLMIEII